LRIILQKFKMESGKHTEPNSIKVKQSHYMPGQAQMVPGS
jgi:hypothetical protein